MRKVAVLIVDWESIAVFFFFLILDHNIRHKIHVPGRVLPLKRSSSRNAY